MKESSHLINFLCKKAMLGQNTSDKNRKQKESSVKMIQQEIVKADLLVKAHLQDIRECSGPVEVLNVMNIQVAGNMKIMKSGIDDLETLAREQDKETDKKEIMKEVDKYLKQYASNQFALRKANLACQGMIEKQSKDELFERTTAVQRKRVRADKESLSKQSSSITDNLVALTNSMSVQVKQSEESLHTLVNSSSTVLDTKEEFKAMGSAIHQSKTLIQKYGRREVTDRVLIIIAAIFFFICVIYVIQKRLFWIKFKNKSVF